MGVKLTPKGIYRVDGGRERGRGLEWGLIRGYNDSE